METINQNIVAPMLCVVCGVDDPDNMMETGWPTRVQCLPSLGSLMSNQNYDRAYVRQYLFRPDGMIEIWLTDKNPNKA